jgi:hypothetical protein
MNREPEGRSSHTFQGIPERLLAPLQRLHLEEDLIVTFFFAFSRFEFALKQAGFLTKEQIGADAQPNWTEFAKKIQRSYDAHNDVELAEAVNYLLTKRPRKQVVAEGHSVDWKDTPEERLDMDWILTLVKRVRNNLFHGGKYAGSVGELAHDTRLLTHSLTILNACLGWDDKVRTSYLA